MPTHIQIPKSILSHRGYSIPIKELSPKQLAKHKANLTVIPYNEKEEFQYTIKPIKIYTETDKRLYMPRHYGMKEFGEPEINKLKTHRPAKANLKTILKPRDHQKPIVEKVLKDFEEIGGGVVSIYCGGGKTAIALMLAAMKGLRTLVVCHTTSLMLQWKERIEEFLPGAKIGIVQQSTLEVEGKDIIIASLKTLALKKYPKGTFDSVGLVVWDEVHLMATNLFSDAFPKLTTKYSLGLSATPFRKDKCEVIYDYFIGPMLYLLKREQNDSITARCVKLLLPSEEIPITYNKWGKIQYTTTLTKVMYNECRTERIVDMIIDFAGKGRKVLILSEYIKHLKQIKTQLTKKIKRLRNSSLKKAAMAKLTPEDRKKLRQLKNSFPNLQDLDLDFTYDLYIGEMKTDARKESEQKDVILGTYKLASVGMDIPKLNTLILASPRKEIEQSVGRILRGSKDKKVKHQPLIVDLIDNHGIFANQANVRKKFYKKYGYVLEHIVMLPDGTIKSRRVVSTIKPKSVLNIDIPGAKPMPIVKMFNRQKRNKENEEESSEYESEDGNQCMIESDEE